MKHLAIKAENISKQYRLGEVGTGTLSHDLNRFWHKIRGNEDPYLQIGESNDRTAKGNSDYVWSLRDINFEIEQGDAVGIIGRNGAGKSTLLKLLSKVTKPTTGNFKVNGRIASLLEVGTGFNPEMTGRENIYLNGAILGMRRAEITRKFDEIVDFAGVERYIDTPVKRYSSGMYVRLAFAVAAHLESEILIVDEVLAVGDAEFQKKCLGKMGDVSKGEGRTVLFVSHNLPSIKQLCNKSIYLKNGQLVAQDETNIILDYYKKDFDLNINKEKFVLENSTIKVNTISIENVNDLTSSDEVKIIFDFDSKVKNQSLAFSVNIFNNEDILLFELFIPFANNGNSEIKNYKTELIIPSDILNSGDYFISVIFARDQSEVLLHLDKFSTFKIEETFENSGKYLRRIPGIIKPKLIYNVY